MRQAVDQIQIDGIEARFAEPLNGLLGHGAWLDAMNGFLNLWLEVLHSERGAIKADLAQSEHVIVREATRRIPRP